jgi:hypothetical protein
MEKAEAFYEKIPNAVDLTKSELVDFFVFFLTVEDGRPSASIAEINRCFDHCHIPRLARINAYLSESSRGKRPNLISRDGSYVLSRHRRDEIKAIINGGTRKVQVSGDLRKLLAKLPDGQRKDFLSEVILCFEVGANRATIVMCWNLAMDGLFDHILTNKLAEFNAEVAKAKGLKVAIVATKEDLSDIKEERFIELCRASGVIGGDVRKILAEKLGTRNTAAHPSNVKIKPSKTFEFVEDMVTNIVTKFG